MKKTTLAILLILSVILTLCAACGSSKSADLVDVSDEFVVTTPEPTEEPTPTPEPTEEPEATPEPTETPAEETDDSGNAGNADSQGTSTSSGQSGTAAAPTPTPVQDKKSVAIDMIGSDVGTLKSAIGGPNSSSYTESCLVLGAEDGFLYYDGFTVATIRRSDGSELVYDVY